MSSEKSLTPQIRFKGFTEAWEQRKLGELLQYEQPQKYIVISSEYDDSFDIPVLTAGQSFILGWTNEKTGIKKASPDNPVIIFDDFVTSSHYVDFPFKIKSSAMKLLSSTNSTNDINFSFNLLKQIDYTPISHMRHWISMFAQFNVYTPIANEQVKIGRIFNKLDSLITLHQRKLDALKKIKSALLEKMFPKDGSNIPEIRFTGFTEAWEQCKLGDLSKILGGFAWSSKEYTPRGEYLVITISNVTGDYFINDSIGNRINLEKESNYVLASGDILVSLTGNVGRVSKMGSSKGVLNQRVAKMIPSKKIEIEFLFQLMRDTKFELKMIESGQGAAQKNISNNNILSYSTYIPNISEQKRIGHSFKKIDSLITLHQRKLDALKKIKSALLEKMFV